MSYVGEFSPAEAEENESFGFDFRKDLDAGETLTAATFILEVIEGTDSSPISRLIGIPDVTETVTKQRVSTLVAGTTYKLQAVVTTNFGNVKSLWGRIACKS